MKKRIITKLDPAAIAELLKATQRKKKTVTNPVLEALARLEIGHGIKVVKNQAPLITLFRKNNPSKVIKTHGVKNVKGKVTSLVVVRTA